MKRLLLLSGLAFCSLVLRAQGGPHSRMPKTIDDNARRAAISAAADKIEAKTIAWRRDFHEHPELGNRDR